MSGVKYGIYTSEQYIRNFLNEAHLKSWFCSLDWKSSLLLDKDWRVVEDFMLVADEVLSEE